LNSPLHTKPTGLSLFLAAVCCMLATASYAETMDEFVRRMDLQPQNRATALAVDTNGGWAGGGGFNALTVQMAIDQAMRNCERRRIEHRVKTQCEIVSINGEPSVAVRVRLAQEQQRRDRELAIERQRVELQKQREALEAKERAAVAANDKERERADQKPGISTGTAFFVTQDGYAVTAYHVVKDSADIRVRDANGVVHAARLVRVDPANDIAVIKVLGKFEYLPIAPSTTARRGTSVFTIGYPQVDIQGIEPKVTEGIISSLSGIQDDPRVFQITTPVQPGNSGGALVTSSGEVVGVVASRLSNAWMLTNRGELPQNVNYAVKSGYLMEVLQSIQGLQFARGKGAGRSAGKSFEDTVRKAEQATILVMVQIKEAPIREVPVRAEPPVAAARPDTSVRPPSGGGWPIAATSCRDVLSYYRLSSLCLNEATCQSEITAMRQLCDRAYLVACKSAASALPPSCARTTERYSEDRCKKAIESVQEQCGD